MIRAIHAVYQIQNQRLIQVDGVRGLKNSPMSHVRWLLWIYHIGPPHRAAPTNYGRPHRAAPTIRWLAFALLVHMVRIRTDSRCALRTGKHKPRYHDDALGANTSSLFHRTRATEQATFTKIMDEELDVFDVADDFLSLNQWIYRDTGVKPIILNR